jgi:hypothetical protein
MKRNKKTEIEGTEYRQPPMQIVTDLLIIVWLLVVCIQYIARYYIIIPDINYEAVYVIMLCVAVLAALGKLAGRIISGKSGGKDSDIRRRAN